MAAARIRALTHSGTFHADEVAALAVLRAAEPGLGPPLFVRTRDPAAIERAELVFDVGGAYDPARGRYDHHMPDPPRRPDHSPYSSAGLIWRDFGRRALPGLLGPRLLGETGLDAATADALWHRLDGSFFLPIDRVDNGLGHADPLGLAALVADLNPTWAEEGGTEDESTEDAAFMTAVGLVEGALRRRAAVLLAEHRARDAVLEAARAAPDPRLVELPASMPWQGAVFEAGLPVLFAVYRDRDGLWRLDCMPPEPGAFAQRLPLPASWAGLRDADLRAATGVRDAVFAHRARFTVGARTREGILALARLALAEDRGR
jgi:uncharacterized UPF0160 family protein